MLHSLHNFSDIQSITLPLQFQNSLSLSHQLCYICSLNLFTPKTNFNHMLSLNLLNTSTFRHPFSLNYRTNMYIHRSNFLGSRTESPLPLYTLKEKHMEERVFSPL